jgi:hypothetical protein
MAFAKLQTRIVPSAPRLLMYSMLSIALCGGVAACLQAQQSGSDESWTTTKEIAAPSTNPSRTTESHSKSGNRTVDKQRMEVLGTDGRYLPSSETETETVQVDATTTRTVMRTYTWDGNGQRKLSQITEEDSRTTASGEAHVARKTSNADVNGNLQVVQREVAETRKMGPNVEETKTSVYRPDSYGGLTQTSQTQELKTRGADDSVEVKSTTLLPDGNGNWGVSAVTEKAIKDDGKNRTTEERISRADSEGRLHESSRTVSKEAETATGEKSKIVETYSSYVPGYSDSGMHLDRRVTTTQRKDSGGEITEQQIEQPNQGNPSDSPKVTLKTRYVVRYATPGIQKTKTVEARDGNGNFNVVSVETHKSDQASASQKPTEPTDKPY